MQWMQVIGKILAALSPEIKAQITAGLDKASERAKATKLPFDDIAIFMFRMVTGL